MQKKKKLDGNSSGLEIVLGVLPCAIKAKICLLLLRKELTEATKRTLKVLANFKLGYKCGLELREYAERNNEQFERPTFQLKWEMNETELEQVNKEAKKGILKVIRIGGWVAMLISLFYGRFDIFAISITINTITYLIQVSKYGV